MGEKPIGRRAFFKSGLAEALRLHGKLNPVDIVANKLVRKVPAPMVPLVDEFTDFIGQMSLSLTAPNDNIKSSLWVPKAFSTAASAVSIFRGYFAEVYPVLVAEMQDKIEGKWSLEKGELDDLANMGERLKGFSDGNSSALNPRDLFRYWMDGYFYKIYSADDWNSVEADVILDVCESHFLATHFRDRGDDEKVSRVLSSSECKQAVKAYQFACDHSLKIRGGLEAANGAIFLAGGTNYVEKAKGAILSLGALQLAASPTSVDRYRNPFDLSQEAMRRRGLLHRSTYIAGGVVEHMLERRSIDLCFNSMNVMNLADLFVSYKNLGSSKQGVTEKEERLELVGKSMAYVFFTVSNQLALETDKANREWVDLVKDTNKTDGFKL